MLPLLWKIGYKATVCNPCDWRPREYNTPPDLMCCKILDTEADVCTAEPERIARRIDGGESLQIYSDGGFRNGRGAAACVAFGIRPGTLEAEAVGIHGVFLATATSPFETELVGAELAINLATDIAQHLKRKRVRFDI